MGYGIVTYSQDACRILALCSAENHKRDSHGIPFLDHFTVVSAESITLHCSGFNVLLYRWMGNRCITIEKHAKNHGKDVHDD